MYLNFRKVKRLDDIIYIFNNITKKSPAKFIMGEGLEKEKTELLFRELVFEDKVRSAGKNNEVRKIFCMSDLFLLPSEKKVLDFLN